MNESHSLTSVRWGYENWSATTVSVPEIMRLTEHYKLLTGFLTSSHLVLVCIPLHILEVRVRTESRRWACPKDWRQLSVFLKWVGVSVRYYINVRRHSLLILKSMSSSMPPMSLSVLSFICFPNWNFSLYPFFVTVTINITVFDIRPYNNFT